ncbi:hypothetical protein KC949_02270 [Candidatus Saccharibacteria bacterium]|nr:hypothetical protein [Candidatus Saccharibacteria bacterium]
MGDIKQKGMTPKKLRTILIVVLALMIVSGIGGFTLFVNKMSSFAQEVALDNAKAHSSNDDLRILQGLDQRLKDDQIAINRTQQITATGDAYTYQTQIVKDISQYATSIGVSIEGYTFNEVSKVETPAATGADTGAAQPLTIPGVRTSSISLSIRSPVSYQSLMKFLRALELNLTKMQIQGISLTRNTEDSNAVGVGPITVEIYIK